MNFDINVTKNLLLSQLFVLISAINTATATVVAEAKMNQESFLKTLEDRFKYRFDDKGHLREIDDEGNMTDNGFKFDVFESKAENQKRYEEIGQIMDSVVYELLVKEGKLEKLLVGNENTKSFIFCSPEIKTKSKVVVMIHGSGVVRAGQWARRLIINEDLDKGTMLPYIKHIQSRGWGVVVMNTNHNYDDDGESIPGSESPEKHAVTVWKEVLAEASATEIVVIAHSYGGVVTMALARNKEVRKNFEKRVIGVFLTDSVHYGLTGNKDLDTKMRKVGKNYVTSTEEVGKELRKSKDDISIFSAGHTQHEWTSWSCMQEIFMDIDHAFKVKINSDSATDDGRDGAMDNSVTTAEEGKTEL